MEWTCLYKHQRHPRNVLSIIDYPEGKMLPFLFFDENDVEFDKCTYRMCEATLLQRSSLYTKNFPTRRIPSRTICSKIWHPFKDFLTRIFPHIFLHNRNENIFCLVGDNYCLPTAFLIFCEHNVIRYKFQYCSINFEICVSKMGLITTFN